MLRIKKGYARKYAYGGTGLFDTIVSLAGRMFTSSAAKTLGSKAVSAATNAALKGVEKGAFKAVDHVVGKVTRPRKRSKTPQQPIASFQRKKPEQVRLNNLNYGSGIQTIHDFVQLYKEIHYV